MCRIYFPTPFPPSLPEASGFVAAVKLYPAGATTNSAEGVTDLLGRCLPSLQAMADVGLPLLVTTRRH